MFDPNDSIKTGDVVAPTYCDGSIMHVVSVEGDDVHCVWVDDETPVSECFPMSELRKLDPKEIRF